MTRPLPPSHREILPVEHSRSTSRNSRFPSLTQRKRLPLEQSRSAAIFSFSFSHKVQTLSVEHSRSASRNLPHGCQYRLGKDLLPSHELARAMGGATIRDESARRGMAWRVKHCLTRLSDGEGWWSVTNTRTDFHLSRLYK